MPFVMAAIHDAQRLANIAPLGVFHATTRATKLKGYDIPEVDKSVLKAIFFSCYPFQLPHFICL